jgi:RNA polymerase sigma-70 factor (ECF subfamily)
MDPTSASSPPFDEQLEQLLHRCAAADSQALEHLYALVSPMLFASITRILRRRALAEEALQDVFINIWQQAGQYSAARGRPMTWMMSIARYRAIDLLRRERFAPALVAQPEEYPADPAPDPDGGSAWLPSAEAMQRCLSLLSEQQAHCLELAYVNGSSHEDISRVMASPLGTVKSWIRRALKSLRECLES